MKKILVAVDGSERQHGVLRAGIALARNFGARVVLVRVVGISTHLPPEALEASPGAVPQLLEEEARHELRRLERWIPEDHRLPSRVDLGTPWESIVRIAREEDVDVVVIGSHGYGALDRLLGTTAARVVNHADRSVLVVRGDGRFEPV